MEAGCDVDGAAVGRIVISGVSVGAGEIVGIPLKSQPHGEENPVAEPHTPGLMFPARPFISNIPQETPG